MKNILKTHAFDVLKKWGQIGDNRCKNRPILTDFIITPIRYNPIKTNKNSS